ncbi:MAG: hypothetical protein JNM34_03430 [Chthonomonadaceae bacterium]|nr:hypothetical protein [Chthonomonadaceae bacterium]
MKRTPLLTFPKSSALCTGLKWLGALGLTASLVAHTAYKASGHKLFPFPELPVDFLCGMTLFASFLAVTVSFAAKRSEVGFGK